MNFVPTGHPALQAEVAPADEKLRIIARDTSRREPSRRSRAPGATPRERRSIPSKSMRFAATRPLRQRQQQPAAAALL